MLEVSSVFKPSIDFGRFFPIDPDLLSRQTMKSVTITPQNTAAAYFSNVRGWRFSEMTGRSVIIGSQKTQIYQRFAGSRQEVFILKIQNDENNAAQQDNGRRFHI